MLLAAIALWTYAAFSFLLLRSVDVLGIPVSCGNLWSWYATNDGYGPANPPPGCSTVMGGAGSEFWLSALFGLVFIAVATVALVRARRGRRARAA